MFTSGYHRERNARIDAGNESVDRVRRRTAEFYRLLSAEPRPVDGDRSRSNIGLLRRRRPSDNDRRLRIAARAALYPVADLVDILDRGQRGVTHLIYPTHTHTRDTAPSEYKYSYRSIVDMIV